MNFIQTELKRIRESLKTDPDYKKLSKRKQKEYCKEIRRLTHVGCVGFPFCDSMPELCNIRNGYEPEYTGFKG